jgi:hypothetical protein
MEAIAAEAFEGLREPMYTWAPCSANRATV